MFKERGFEEIIADGIFRRLEPTGRMIPIFWGTRSNLQIFLFHKRIPPRLGSFQFQKHAVFPMPLWRTKIIPVIQPGQEFHVCRWFFAQPMTIDRPGIGGFVKQEREQNARANRQNQRQGEERNEK